MRFVTVAVFLLFLGFLAWLFLHRGPPQAPPKPAQATTLHRPTCPRVEPPARPAAPAPPPGRTRWMMLGAAEGPSQNPVSIEQDAEQLRRVLGPSGVLVLGGGPGARDVQVQVAAGRKRGDGTLEELADLFSPRGGRDSEYRPSKLPVNAASSPREVERTLRRLITAGGGPLLLYVAGHGEQGDTVGRTSVTLWGGHRLTVEELARLLDEGTRDVVLVVTSCYGGAFAETVFEGAIPSRSAARNRCGFFATTHDLPSAGCDPNPARELQDGYALHFLNALVVRHRSGHPVPAGTLDLDGDGRISFAEAHASARVDLDSVDVPTSTSERFLRQVAPPRGARSASAPLPEERAVARALARRTGLPEVLVVVKAALASRERTIARAKDELEAALDVEDERARAAIAELLARWPVLDDPWHPDFQELLRCQRQAIRDHLSSSRAYADYVAARDDAEDADDRHFDLRRRAAPVERLARALETIELAERLYAKGGKEWSSYAALLACERIVPVTEAPAAAR